MARILYMWVIRSRSALPITETELKLMAAAAMMGLNGCTATSFLGCRRHGLFWEML